uniref:Uncharacterized protein n=1 Tax=Chlamydomonas leiostraca TaxID=1034604 RepID=A0A7S0RXV4_9CHLO|mmetsp:Transcript_34553/g.87371  ORF Transcript_34553/g.87371 Transcript_34553/m.87371 type:complete len:233 (+) Transcript_34553:76-774(+)
MTTTITIEVAGKVLDLKAVPNEQLAMSVQMGVARASMQMGVALKADRVLFTGSNAPVDNWLTRSVGTQDITVVTVEAPSGGTMMSMLQALVDRVSSMEVREAEAWAPRLRNTVAQILLHACGEAGFYTTTTDYFSKKLGQADVGVQQLAASMGVSPQQLVGNADAVIMCRSKSIHPSTLADLEDEIAAVQRCITPALQRACTWECRFLMSYNDIKKAFPDRFHAQSSQEQHD